MLAIETPSRNSIKVTVRDKSSRLDSFVDATTSELPSVTLIWRDWLVCTRPLPSDLMIRRVAFTLPFPNPTTRPEIPRTSPSGTTSISGIAKLVGAAIAGITAITNTASPFSNRRVIMTTKNLNEMP